MTHIAIFRSIDIEVTIRADAGTKGPVDIDTETIMRSEEGGRISHASRPL